MRKDLKALVAKNPDKYRMFPFHGEALAHLLLEHGCTRPGASVTQASDAAFSAPSDEPAEPSEPR